MAALVWFVTALVITVVHGCAVFMQGIGTVSPVGDVTEPVGATIRLQCLLNKTLDYVKPENIVWNKDRRPLSKDFLNIIDNHTVEVVISNATIEDSGVYMCLLKDNKETRFVCHNNVMVGHAPTNVSDFQCISHNWQYMICSYVKPYNPVKPKYKLYYERKFNRIKMGAYCNLTHDKKRNMDFCNITASSSVRYSPVEKFYHFTLTASNAFGQKNWSYIVPHFERVKPNAPEDIGVFNLSTTSVNLKWQPPVEMISFQPGFDYRIYYRSEWDVENRWKILNGPANLSLNNLQPHTNYTFKIQCKSTLATDNKLWSENATYSVLTLSDVPGMPPNIINGSFQEKQYLNNRNIIVFWQMIPKYQENGQKFRYNVTATSSHDDVKPHNISDNFAVFLNLFLEESYEIVINSVNENGTSEKSSIIRVPRKPEHSFQPESFNVVYYGRGIYELSWKPPKYKIVDGYTLFWCNNIKPHPFICRGNLSWAEIKADRTAYNVTLKDEFVNYHFAIASRANDISSGMLWATCTIPYNGTINRMKKVILTAISSSSLRVSWKLDCSERIGIVTGFKMYYCRVAVNSTTAKCIGEQFSAFKNGSDAEFYELSDLKPYSYYKVTVAAMTRAGEGEQSRGLIERTQESIPSMANEQLAVTDVTNTSLSLSWEQPKNANGQIIRYIIKYNSKSISPLPLDARQINITDLRSFTNYTLKLLACNSAGCSDDFNPVVVPTLIGVPGLMSRPQITQYNQSFIILSFEDPAYPNAPIMFYNLMVIVTNDDGVNETYWHYNITTPEYLTAALCDENKLHNAVYNFGVQAATIANDELLKGPMSEFRSYSCFAIAGPSSTKVLYAVMGTVLAVLIFLFLVYGYFRIRRKYVEMKNIQIKLPVALESNNYKSPNLTSILSYPNTKQNGWTKDPKQSLYNNPRQRNTSGETRLSVTSMDELLHKSDNPTNDASSGLSSVSSVQTTRSNLSSDSANDLDSLPPTTPDAVFVDNPLINVHKLLMPPAKLDVLPEASPPANYSQFGQHFELTNDGYLPTVSSRSINAEYVLPSEPLGSYSQLGMSSENPAYMNLHNGPEPSNEQQSSYSRVGEAAEAPRNLPMINSNGYVAATLSNIPASFLPSKDVSEAEKSSPSKIVPGTSPNKATDSGELPVEYSRLSFHDPKTSNGYVTLPDVATSSNVTNADVPSTSRGHYVALDHKNEVELANDDKLQTSMTSDEAMKSSVTSDEMMKSSVTSDEAMKSSMTSDGYDSPGPYSRVVSMNFDESDTKES